MDWIPLGHAGWLVDLGPTRVLIDPVLGDTWHDGVFAPWPPRHIEVEALAPDVIVITHRHPDHFDLPSLAALVERWPDARVLTSDTLVAETASALGARHVEVLPARHRVDLPGGSLWTTPSFTKVVEWGVVVVCEAGTAWHQVDTVLKDPSTVRSVLDEAAAGLGRPELADVVDLAIVRWHPLRQVAFALGEAVGFPRAAWQDELARAAALSARLVVPGACGSAYAPGHAWLNALAYPATEARFTAALQALRPDLAVACLRPGEPVHVRPEGVEVGAPVSWITVEDAPDPRTFHPHAIPPVRDPDRLGRGQHNVMAAVDAWVRTALRPALAARWPALGLDAPLRCALVGVGPDGTEVWNLCVHAPGTDVARDREPDPEHDLLVTVAASRLVDVIEGRSPWGALLLGGELRATSRALRWGAEGLEPVPIPPIFPYVALPYDVATDRWVRAWVAERLSARAPGTPRS